MPKKPLVAVTAAAVCDYVIWMWASDRGSAILALITGLALAPLLLATVWLAILAVVRAVITRPMDGSQAPNVAAGSGGEQHRGTLRRPARLMRAAAMRALAAQRGAPLRRPPLAPTGAEGRAEPPATGLPIVGEPLSADRRIATWQVRDSSGARDPSRIGGPSAATPHASSGEIAA